MQPGQTLEHYRLTEQIGQGGMGVVWRATDTKLDRDVAIKLLPQGFAEDADRLARFRREAKLLASLNHKHIAQIYGVAEEAGTFAIVMELIEGQSLDERLAHGPLPEAEARRIAMHIAEALEAAHDKGIVHRDLKPANVKITPQDEVKVLDFGLAKTVQAETEQGDVSHSPTMTAMATQAGVVMGTAHYMSPEQARGKPVDRRADIWAFGCVLYEMLVGRSPFRGSDISEIVAHVITQEPDFDTLPGGLPGQVDDLIRRCLRKDPRMRLSDMGTARVALHEAGEAPLPSAAALAKQEWGAASRSGSGKLLAVTVLAGLLLGAAITWFAFRPASRVSVALTQLDIVLDPPPTHGRIALSPDGTTLVYTGSGADGRRMLHTRRLDSHESLAIPGTEGGHVPVFSPDGQQIAFFSAGRLKRVSLLGGLPEPIAAMPGEVRGAFWSEDDEIIYSTSSTFVPYRVSARGGEGRPVDTESLDPSTRLEAPRPLPGSRSILVTRTSPELDGARIAVLDLESGASKTLVRGLDALYLPSGALLFFQRDRLVSAPFDADAGSLTGTEQAAPLERPVIYRESIVHERFYAEVSADGTLAYMIGVVNETNTIHHLDRDGKIVSLDLEGEFAAVSPTGGKIVLLGADVVVHDPRDGVSTRVTFSSTAWYPRWSADGQRIVFSEQVGDERVIRDMAADGSDVRDLHAFDARISAVPTSTGPDGTVMGYFIDPDTSRDIWAIGPDGTLKMILQTQHNERAGAISPDGKLFAYVTDEEGSDDVFIRQFPDSGRKWQVSSDGGIAPVWSADGRELYYRRGDTIVVVEISGASAVRVGESRDLFTSDRITHDRFGNATFGLAEDGGLLVPIAGESNVRVRIVQGWKPE